MRLITSLLTILCLLSVHLVFATEQDSLTNKYLDAKDKAIRFVAKQNKGTEFELLLKEVIEEVTHKEEFEQAAFYIQFCKQHKNEGLEIDSLLQLAVNEMRASNCKRGLGEALFFVGVRAIDENDVEELHSVFNEAAKCFKATNYDLGVIYAFSRLANYYSKTDNFELANKYNQQLLNLVDKSTDRNLKEMVYLNVANFYTEQAQADEALEYYKMLEESINISNNTRRLKPLYNNLGVIYIYKHDWANAKKYINKSLAIKQQEKDSLGMFASYQNLFRISIKTQQMQDAEFYHTIMSDWLTKLKIPSEQILSFKFNTTDYYILKGEREQAQAALYDFSSDKDSISNAVFSEQLLEIEEAFEIERRDQTIKLMQQEDELQQAELKSLKVIVFFVIAFIVVLLINGFYMKRHWNKLIRADEKLKLKQGELIALNKKLEQSSQSKDRILSIIGHDLRGPVGGLKELVELYMELPELEPQDVTNLLQSARVSSSSTYYLLENLLTWANSQRGEISYSPQTTPIYPVVKQTVQLLEQSINNKNVDFIIDVQKSLSLKVDVNMFRTVIRNLVSNAIRYTPENSLVSIAATISDHEVRFTVIDKGTGITADKLNQLFDKKETYYIGSDISKKGTGLGLILCKEFVELHGGKIWVNSHQEVGTQVCFSIPTVSTKVIETKLGKEVMQS
ncbi:hypothetical protein J1N10_09360 [Carboxylicivirga sp. A043]|uniref:sensor histidine kinase n=1 Tax=Carboxylicivirga litoralis TaxID=2816963 RepID=UPI0021CAF924|nr:tetratricopeptide repeat-containing sensor histidine kinase [Carboxylicivirga sp. A043]MCU4156186.1 hypothetical protein [Carboxylicivirga sp. A043]